MIRIEQIRYDSDAHSDWIPYLRKEHSIRKDGSSKNENSGSLPEYNHGVTLFTTSFSLLIEVNSYTEIVEIETTESIERRAAAIKNDNWNISRCFHLTHLPHIIPLRVHG